METEVNRAGQKFFMLSYFLRLIEDWDPQIHFLEANIVDEAYFIVGSDDEAIASCPNTDEDFPSSMGREEIPYTLWVIRQALDKIAPDYHGMVREWHNAPSRTKDDVFELLNCAKDLVTAELEEIPDLFNEGPNRSKLILHREGEKDGSKLCAMSALSKRLGYIQLTDTPSEVDPGLTALINLLNDRANERARQLLIWRLEYIPNTGRTDICALIANVYFPIILRSSEFNKEASVILECKTLRSKATAYAELGERFLSSDGSGYLASGCMVLSAAIKSRDPVARDILSIAAASQIVFFENGDGWFELLYILDFILGLKDSPSGARLQSQTDCDEYFGDEAAQAKADEMCNPTEPF